VAGAFVGARVFLGRPPCRHTPNGKWGGESSLTQMSVWDSAPSLGREDAEQLAEQRVSQMHGLLSRDALRALRHRSCLVISRMLVLHHLRSSSCRRSTSASHWAFFGTVSADERSV
jgi:hypothetical protein